MKRRKEGSTGSSVVFASPGAAAGDDLAASPQTTVEDTGGIHGGRTYAPTAHHQACLPVHKASFRAASSAQ